MFDGCSGLTSLDVSGFKTSNVTEMSYMFCTVLGITCLWCYAKAEDAEWYKSPWFWLSAVFALCAYHIRTVGMALMVSIIIFFLFRKEWLQAAVSLVTQIALMLPWILRNKFYGLESRYMGTVMTVNPWRPEEGTISSVSEFIEKMQIGCHFIRLFRYLQKEFL